MKTLNSKTETILPLIMWIVIFIAIIATPAILTYINYSLKYNNWDYREWPFMSTEKQKQAEAK